MVRIVFLDYSYEWPDTNELYKNVTKLLKNVVYLNTEELA